MKIFNASGTLGDTYTICCKLINLKEEIKILHNHRHPEFDNLIREIYSLVPNVIDIKFSHNNELNYDPNIPMINGHCKRHPFEPDYINMNFFPNFEFKSNLRFDFPYIVLQAKAGRENQLRELRLKTINKIIRNSKYKVILIGTSKKYESVKNCLNLINKTTLFDTFNLIKNSKYFVGLMGVMAFVALSHRVNCNLVYTDQLEMETMVYNMAWEKYCKKIISLEDYIKLGYSFLKKIKIILFKLPSRVLRRKPIVYIRNLFFYTPILTKYHTIFSRKGL